ncbi:MAG: hypothetical protein A6F72_03460 [Cycloclasticus sp. symbiont of Poecilosclerida sp. N]|nr:MAG: hypothetical protein A6F72_03460 [Cycloclasticus sp. symbiont of Poecilosclerida sp. N]
MLYVDVHLSYRQLFDKLGISGEQAKISNATLAGDVFGSERLHTKIDRLISRVTRRASHGGDRKSKEYKNQTG